MTIFPEKAVFCPLGSLRHSDNMSLVVDGVGVAFPAPKRSEIGDDILWGRRRVLRPERPAHSQ